MITVLAAALQACSIPAPAATAEGLFATLDPDQFPAARSLLLGFAAADREAGLRPGDAALVAVELRSGAELRRLLGLLEVGRAAGPELLLTTVTWFTSEGERLRGDRVTVGEDPSSASDPSEAIAALVSTSVRKLFAQDPALRDVAYSIADRPGLLDVLWGSRDGLRFENRVEDGRWRPAGISTESSIRHATVHVLWGDAPVARAELLVVPPLGSFALTRGVVGAVIRSPSDADRRVVVRLVANRRGG